MLTSSCEDFGIHLGIKGNTGAQHMQRDEVYPGIASDHREGGFSHTY